MFPTILAATDAGSVVVAVAIIVLIGAITLVAMVKYDIDAALKMWAALGTVTGLVVGGMGTYFFTKDQLSTTSSALAATRSALRTSESQKAQAADQIQGLAESIKPFAASEQGAEKVSKLEDVGRKLKYTPATLVLEASPEAQPTAAPTQ